MFNIMAHLYIKYGTVSRSSVLDNIPTIYKHMTTYTIMSTLFVCEPGTLLQTVMIENNCVLITGRLLQIMEKGYSTIPRILDYWEEMREKRNEDLICVYTKMVMYLGIYKVGLCLHHEQLINIPRSENDDYSNIFSDHLDYGQLDQGMETLCGLEHMHEHIIDADDDYALEKSEDIKSLVTMLISRFFKTELYSVHNPDARSFFNESDDEYDMIDFDMSDLMGSPVLNTVHKHTIEMKSLQM